MPASRMPKDAQGVSVPVLGFKDDSSQTIAIGASSARNSVAFDAGTKVVTIWATANCRINQGGSSIAATSSSSFIPANTLIDVSIWLDDVTQRPYIAVIQDSGSTGNLYVCERI